MHSDRPSRHRYNNSDIPRRRRSCATFPYGSNLTSHVTGASFQEASHAPETRCHDDSLSIPPSSESGSSSNQDDGFGDCVVPLTDQEEPDSQKPIGRDGGEGRVDSHPADVKLHDPSSPFNMPSSSLAQKARMILETELMFEKLIAQSRVELDAIECQISELGTGYLAVPRAIVSRPPRRMVEIPNEASTVDGCGSENQGGQLPIWNERDENSTRSIKAVTASSRPPLAPKNESTSRTAKPLLTNVPIVSSRSFIS
jgi:hypothetical protein